MVVLTVVMYDSRLIWRQPQTESLCLFMPSVLALVASVNSGEF